MSYTIVAIPNKDDHVWDVSSEKVPHMTILALGDTLNNEARVLDFLGHVVETSLCRFGLMVDHRGTLGPQNADVLFFEKYGLKKLVDARANLLQDPNIFASYNSIAQYPVWTPHLTLGYPATPAKPDKRDYPISWVNFDRIALWTGDYEGPEFELNENYGLLSDTPAALAYAMHVDEGFEHFGVKGMHWGQRKAQPRASGYSANQQKYDAQQHGHRHAARINARVAAGADVKTAREAEAKAAQRRSLALTAGVLAAYAAVRLGPSVARLTTAALHETARRKMATEGAKAAADLFANGHGITNYKTVNLAFNGVRGVWE